jgi:UDP-N-acetylmuramoyl-L-alanyl-D-glutamate--2,6-diaminopimelate ligase
MLAQGLGWNGASIGTLTNERTTPAAPELLRTLADLAKTFDDEAENSVVALEVSSHALDQHRIDGLVFDAVAFTNLTHDHLDYHLTMENYAAAKAKLFSPTFAETAVLWVDDQFGQELFERTTLTAHAVSQIDASNVVMTLEGTSFEWRGRSMHSPLLGSYNLDNVLVALTLLSSVGASDEALETALGTISPVPGRFDVLRGKGLTVIVDYAHTPDGLQRLLRDVRALAPAARLHCVFGCGGDRDVAKRPEMGAVALEGADVVYVTSDNPRSEDPEAILDDIVRGMSASDRVHRIVDRAEAIRHAIDESAPGDVVIVAGKGHETTQTIGSEVHAFSDRHVVAESLE